MGWVGNKWFPRYPGDYCTGFYHPPEDGSVPIWKLQPPNFEGTRDNRPMWVMVNGREISGNDIAMKQGSSDCEVALTTSPPPHGRCPAKYFCHRCAIWLRDEDDVLLHLDNKSLFGQWAKEMGIKLEKAPKQEAAPVELPDTLAAEIRTFLEPIIAASTKQVDLWKAGKTGALIGVAMKAAKGTYEGKHIEKMLKELVG